jgi:hypothetical protein
VAIGRLVPSLRDSAGLVQLTRHLRAGLSHSVPAALGQRSMMTAAEAALELRVLLMA